MTPKKAVYDSCVLFPAPLRSLLVYTALSGLVDARWTDAIHQEWMRNVILTYPDLTAARMERVRDLMNAAIPAAMVTGFEHLIPGLVLPDPDDRHVLAAAIQAEAEVIVTFNLKDFPDSILKYHNIEAKHPDEFLVALLKSEPVLLCEAIKKQRAGLRNPPKTADELLTTFSTQGLVQTVHELRQFADSL